ncbi:MAG TPA: hypothetical protein VH280_23990 [Verrucomicrobiae bacterium]|nr:hypothetical protein [Verrucomicrobiae bacterium]
MPDAPDGVEGTPKLVCETPPSVKFVGVAVCEPIPLRNAFAKAEFVRIGIDGAPLTLIPLWKPFPMVEEPFVAGIRIDGTPVRFCVEFAKEVLVVAGGVCDPVRFRGLFATDGFVAGIGINIDGMSAWRGMEFANGKLVDVPAPICEPVPPWALFVKREFVADIGIGTAIDDPGFVVCPPA